MAGWRKAPSIAAGLAFGTKLLYFAGYTTEHRPRPLVLDKRVRAALQTVAPGTVPAKDYLRYLELAERWAADRTWRQQPDVVEYALPHADLRVLKDQQAVAR